MTKEEIKIIIYKYYKERVYVGFNKQSYDSKISCFIPKRNNNNDIIIVIREDIVLVFNNMIRRDNNCFSNNNYVKNYRWEDLGQVIDDKNPIIPIFTKIGINKNIHYKILLMKLDTLYNSYKLLYELLSISSDDYSAPLEIVNNPNYNYNRKRYTVSKWNRSHYFRINILKNYNNQCAICRCKEEKLLQGCHIKPVCEYGSDNISNGICLCANHHIMLDKNLIKINYKKNVLSYVSDSVKQMSWYADFIEKYNGILVKPLNYNKNK